MIYCPGVLLAEFRICSYSRMFNAILESFAPQSWDLGRQSGNTATYIRLNINNYLQFPTETSRIFVNS